MEPLVRKDPGVLLASGGMDSTTLAYWLDERQVTYLPLFINYGQHCHETELTTLKELLPVHSLERLEVVNVSDIYNGTTSVLISERNLWLQPTSYAEMYLPYRSLLLLTIGAAYAQARGIQDVYSGFINSNHATEIDCSADFFNKLTPLFSGYGGVKMHMPFRDLSKAEVARIGISTGAPIGQTFSCQASSRIPCGACPNCVDRLDALDSLTAE